MKMPLTYFFGHLSPKADRSLYDSLASEMASKINERLGNDSDSNASGVIIDTFAWSDEADLDSILHVQREFAVDVIFVTDDRLFSSLKPRLEHSPVVVVKLARSGGVVTRDHATRLRKRKNQIDSYFYGKKDGDDETRKLTPHRKELKFRTPVSDGLAVWKLGQPPISEAMASYGTSTRQDPKEYLSITPSNDLSHSVLAVLQPSQKNSTQESGIADGIGKPTTYVCAGFIYVVQFQSDGIIALVPSPSDLPSNDVIFGSIKWLD
jgi:polyribonucleotide 5'-hydroxyl-kinase